MAAHAHAVHSLMARLLSAEGLTVVHDRAARTAGFNTASRQLTLPMWAVSDTAYSMLLMHEVAHALWTPAPLSDAVRALWPECRTETQRRAINLFEDLRVDAAARARWPGATRTYALAFDELVAAGILEPPPATAPLPVRVLAIARGIPGVALQSSEEAEAAEMLTPRDFAHVVTLARRWSARFPESSEASDTSDAAGTTAHAETDDGDPPSSADEPHLKVLSRPPAARIIRRRAAGVRLMVGAAGAAPVGGGQQARGVRSVFDDPLDKWIDIVVVDYVRPQVPRTVQFTRRQYFQSHEGMRESRGVTTYVIDRLPEERRFESPAFDDDHPVLQDLAAHPLYRSAKTTWAAAAADAQVMASAFRVSVDAARAVRGGRVSQGQLDPRRLHAHRYSTSVFTRRLSIPAGLSHGMLVAVDLADPYFTWTNYPDAIRGLDAGRPGPLLRQLVTLVTFCRLMQMPYHVVAWGNHALGPDWPDEAIGAQSLPRSCRGPLCTVSLFSHRDSATQHRRRLNMLSALWLHKASVTRETLARDAGLHACGVLESGGGHSPLVDVMLCLPEWARALGSVERRLLLIMTGDWFPDIDIDWTCRILTDTLHHCTLVGPHRAKFVDGRKDSPLWHALCDRVRLLTGGALIGYSSNAHIDRLFWNNAARLHHEQDPRYATYLPRTPGSALLLGAERGFDAHVPINTVRYEPEVEVASGRPFLTQMGRLLAQAVLSEDSIVSQEH